MARMMEGDRGKRSGAYIKLPPDIPSRSRRMKERQPVKTIMEIWGEAWSAANARRRSDRIRSGSFPFRRYVQGVGP